MKSKTLESTEGLDNAEPMIGVTALESVGIAVDPAPLTPKRLPTIQLK